MAIQTILVVAEIADPGQVFLLGLAKVPRHHRALMLYEVGSLLSADGVIEEKPGTLEKPVHGLQIMPGQGVASCFFRTGNQGGFQVVPDAGQFCGNALVDDFVAALGQACRVETLEHVADDPTQAQQIEKQGKRLLVKA